MTLRLPAVLLVLLIGLAVAGLLALGVWQLQRNEWKQQLVSERNARFTAERADARELAAMPPQEVDYRRAAASGTWDHEHALIVANRARLQVKGEEVLVPLRLDSGGPALLVLRGWYPEAERDRVLASLREETRGSVSGLARRMQAGGARRTPAGTWTRIDAGSMAGTLPYPVLGWILIEGEPVERLGFGDGSLPVQQFLPFRNTVPHVEYALTWFGLAVALIAVSVYRFVFYPRRDPQTARRVPPAPPHLAHQSTAGSRSRSASRSADHGDE